MSFFKMALLGDFLQLHLRSVAEKHGREAWQAVCQAEMVWQAEKSKS